MKRKNDTKKHQADISKVVGVAIFLFSFFFIIIIYYLQCRMTIESLWLLKKLYFVTMAVKNHQKERTTVIWSFSFFRFLFFFFKKKHTFYMQTYLPWISVDIYVMAFLRVLIHRRKPSKDNVYLTCFSISLFADQTKTYVIEKLKQTKICFFS